MGEADPFLGTPARQLPTQPEARELLASAWVTFDGGLPGQDRGFRRYHHEAASGPRPLTRPLAESRTCTAVGTPACFAADQQGVAFRGPVRYPTPLTTKSASPSPHSVQRNRRGFPRRQTGREPLGAAVRRVDGVPVMLTGTRARLLQ